MACGTEQANLSAIVISEITQIDEDISKLIQDHLSDQYGDYSVKHGGDDPYANDTQYEECSGLMTPETFYLNYAIEKIT